MKGPVQSHPMLTRPSSSRGGDADIREIEWDALIPEDWRPEVLMDRYNADDLSDDDPRAQELLDKLKALWKEAPGVPALEGQRVKLPGFVVPLEMDAKKILFVEDNVVNVRAVRDHRNGESTRKVYNGSSDTCLSHY